MPGINIIFEKIRIAANVVKSGAGVWLKGVARIVNSGSGRIVDFSENENEGTLNTGRHYSFDGSNDRITIVDTINGIKTASVWINPTTTTQPLFDFDGGATTIYLIGGAVATKGITNPFIYVDGLETTAVTSGSWQLVTVSSNTSWTSTSFTFGEEGSNYYNGLASYVKLFSDFIDLERHQELYYNPERIIPATTQWPQLLLFFSCMENGDVSGYIHESSYYSLIGRIQGPSTAIAAAEPAPQTAIQNHQKRLNSVNNSYVDIPHNDKLNFGASDDWSIACKFWVRATTGSQGLIVKDALNSAYSLTIQSGSLSFRGAGLTGALTFALSSLTSYHVVCTVSGGTTAKLYVNGVLEDSGTITAAAATTSALQLMGYASANEMNGLMYYAAVYGKTLSEYQAADFGNGYLPTEVDGGFLRGAWINEGPNTWSDVSGNGNTGTVNGASSFTYDMEGLRGLSAMRLPFYEFRKNRLLLRGAGFVEVADSNTIDALTGVSIDCWIKLYTIGTIQQIAYKASAYGLKVQANNTIRISFWQTSEETLDSTTTLIADTWYHVVGVYDGSDTSIYINGALDKTTDVSSGNIDTNTNDLLIGAASTTPTLALDGDIGQMRVYTSGLTALEVAQNYRKEEKLYNYI